MSKEKFKTCPFCGHAKEGALKDHADKCYLRLLVVAVQNGYTEHDDKVYAEAWNTRQSAAAKDERMKVLESENEAMKLTSEIFATENELFIAKIERLKAEMETARKCNSCMSRQLRVLEWVNAKIRLPEEDGIYLTKYKGDGRQGLRDEIWIRTYYFGGIYSENWNSKKPNKYTVTHWMPIPDIEPLSCNPVGDECDQDARDKAVE